MAFYVAGGGGVFCGGVAIESIGSEARAPGDRNSVFLFLYEAIHELVASVSGIPIGIVDLRYDRENPRTRQRALVTGALSLEFAWLFTLLAVAVFFAAAWQLNPLAVKLAPLAIAILFFYSFTKRFTNWSHLFLGFRSVSWTCATTGKIRGQGSGRS